MNNETWELEGIYDVRPIDWFSGKRTSIPDDELPECSRCGKKHNKVYQVTSNKGRSMTVGSGCWKRVVFENSIEIPEKEIKRARKVAREREKAAAIVEITKVVRELSNKLNSLPSPLFELKDRIQYEVCNGTPNHTETWVSEDGIHVCLQTHMRPGFEDFWVERTEEERKAELIREWRYKKSRIIAKETGAKNTLYLSSAIRYMADGNDETANGFIRMCV